MDGIRMNFFWTDSQSINLAKGALIRF